MTTAEMQAIERQAMLRGTRVYWVNPDRPRGWIPAEQTDDDEQ